jgi:hypothetical protein
MSLQFTSFPYVHELNPKKDHSKMKSILLRKLNKHIDDKCFKITAKEWYRNIIDFDVMVQFLEKRGYIVEVDTHCVDYGWDNGGCKDETCYYVSW